MNMTAGTRWSAPAVFGEVYDEVVGDARWRPVARTLRNHAVEVACLSRELAPLVEADPYDAFAAGLLHDIGELLLMHRDPAGYGAFVAERWMQGELLVEEKVRFGTDHALLGAEYLLDRRVPDVVADAVADHHDPFVSTSSTTVVVAAADELLGGDPTRRHAVSLLRIDEGSRPDLFEP